MPRLRPCRPPPLALRAPRSCCGRRRGTGYSCDQPSGDRGPVHRWRLHSIAPTAAPVSSLHGAKPRRGPWRQHRHQEAPGGGTRCARSPVVQPGLRPGPAYPLRSPAPAHGHRLDRPIASARLRFVSGTVRNPLLVEDLRSSAMSATTTAGMYRRLLAIAGRSPSPRAWR